MNAWKKISLRRKIIPVLSIILILLGCQEAPQNTPPEISDLIIYPSQPKAGQLVLLTGIAEDQDGDALSYKWVASGGSFLDTLGSNPIQWQAPTEPDTINIFLHVTDREATTTATTSFYLEPGLGIVAGHVRDATTEFMLENVVVNISGLEVTTGSDGYFIFEDVPTGNNIPISASVLNYMTYASLITVNVDENIQDISMVLLTEVGRIAGYVTDIITGEKLAGVVVQTGEIADTTGIDGYYELYNVPMSNAVPVRASYAGYNIFSSLIDVDAGYNTNNIELEPNIATISGRVISEANGSLLSEVVVTINQYQDTTNAAGYFEIANIPITSNASVSAVLDGYITAYSTIDIVGGINNLDLSLSDNPGELSGWVRSSLDGSVLSNVSVSVGNSAVITLSDGSYTAGGLPAGPTLITCSITGYETFTDLRDIEPGSNTLDIEMVRVVGSISGFLRDSLAESSVSGAVILLGNLTTISEADGSYEFVDVPIGQRQLTVNVADFLAYSRLLNIEAGSNLQNIQLIQSTGTVLGVVQNAATREGLAGATVSIGDVSTETDDSGYYELTSIEYGVRLLICQLDNYVEFEETIVVEYGENVHTIDLESSVGNVSGVVTHAVSGVVLPNVILSIGDLVDTTDADGYYGFEDVAIGSANIRAEFEGYVTMVLPIDVSAGENIVSIELSADHGLLGGFISDSYTGLFLDSVSVKLIGIDTVLTTANGYYEIENVPIGIQHTLKAQLNGYDDYIDLIEVQTENNELNIELLADHGMLMGYVTDLTTGGALDSVAVILGSDTARTETDGYYEFDNVPTGEQHTLTIQLAGYEDYFSLTEVQVGDNVLNIELSADHGLLMGYITDFTTGVLLDSVAVILELDTVTTGVDGYYEFESIPVGDNYSFKAQRNGYVDHVEWVSISPGDTVVDVGLVSSN